MISEYSWSKNYTVLSAHGKTIEAVFLAGSRREAHTKWVETKKVSQQEDYLSENMPDGTVKTTWFSSQDTAVICYNGRLYKRIEFTPSVYWR
jgi:hypothetical protein